MKAIGMVRARGSRQDSVFPPIHMRAVIQLNWDDFI